MPKKSRKGRMKYRVRRSPKVSTIREVNQRPQPLPLQSKEVPVAKSPISNRWSQDDRIRNVPKELKRILIIAGVLLVTLVVLSLLLR